MILQVGLKRRHLTPSALSKVGKKLCAFDMDGTLLTSKKQISPKNLDAVERVMKAGYEVTLITGRAFGQIEIYRQLLGITLPVVLLNGAMVGQPGNWQRTLAMDEEEVQWILQMADREKWFVHLYKASGIYTQAIKGRVIGQYGGRFEEGKTAKAGLHVVDDLSAVLGPCYKILIPFPTAKAQVFMQKWLEDLSGVVVYQAGSALEIASKGASKGAGIKLLAESMGIEAKDVIVFGDQDNDISMFEYAGRSIAMGNAIPELKSRASYVTESNEEDGVAKAIDRWILQNE